MPTLTRLPRALCGDGTRVVGRLSKPQTRRPQPRWHNVSVLAAVVGIDLGTSNSAVAVTENGVAKVLPIQGSSTIPSVVAFTEDGRTVVGTEAKHQAAANAWNTFNSVKRLIGRQFDECLLDNLAFAVQPGPDGQAMLSCPAKGKALAPEEVSACLLRELINHAQAYLQEEVDGAVVTVPAYFNERQREATLRAASLAGLRKAQLLQEPVAAAMAYGLGRPYDADTILVFDLGGGTYDVSVLESFEGILEVLATAGDAQLGGDDFDSALMAHLAAAHLHPVGSQLRVVEVQQLREAAEQAKIALSADQHTQVQLPGGQVAEMDLAEFESVTAHLRARLCAPLRQIGRETFVAWADEAMLEPCRPDTSTVHPAPGPAGRAASGNEVEDASSSAGHVASGVPGNKFAPPPRRISQVVLVGGSTRMPSVRHFLKQLTGIQPRTDVNPDECVALGAAIQAGILLGQMQGLELMDGSYSWDLHQRATGFSGFA